MSTQPSTTRRNSKRLNHDRNFKLRFELLEERRLLSADGTFVPSDTDVFSQEQFESSTHCSHDLQDDELSSIMQAVANAVTRESGPDPGGRHWNSNECASSNDVLDPFFEEFGFYINNKSYCLLSDLQYKPSIFFSTSLLNEELEDLPNENGELSNERETWDLEITASVGGCQSPSTLEGGYLQLHEGHDSVLDFPGSMADPVSTDYMVVTLPALPEGYVTTITFGGSASDGPDYYVCAPYGNSYWSVSSGYLHSGPSVDLYVIVIDDRISEADDETVSITMGTPVLQPGLTVTPYNFNQIENTVSAKIIDNDGWKIGVVAETGGNTSETVISETNNGETNIRVSRLDDGTGHGSDLHYYIDATIAVSGTANASDYQIYLNNANGGRSLITPSNGRFTVRIQENEAFATLTIVARDDSVVEQLYETINLSVVEAKGYPPFISFSADTTPFTVSIKDNDKLTLDMVQFKDNLDLISDSQDSFGENWKNSVHWIDLYPNQTLPVAYACDDTLKCQATITGLKDESLSFKVKAEWANGESDWVTLNGSCTLLTFTQDFITSLGARQALYDPNFTVTWKFRIDGEEERLIGESVNPLYVTYRRPTLNAQMYHTVVHTACQAYMTNIEGIIENPSEGRIQDPVAPASVDERNSFEAIWTAFTSLAIHKINLINGVICNGEVLSYYGRGADSSVAVDTISSALVQTTATGYIQTPTLAREYATLYDPLSTYTIAGLLYRLDGTCGGWQDFAVNVFRSQGFDVSKMTFQRMPSGNPSIINMFQVSPNTRGQGTGVYSIFPREFIWDNHAVFVYDGVVWDPSYGTNYGSQATAVSTFVQRIASAGYVDTSVQNRPLIYTPLTNTTDDMFYTW